MDLHFRVGGKYRLIVEADSAGYTFDVGTIIEIVYMNADRDLGCRILHPRFVGHALGGLQETTDGWWIAPFSLRGKVVEIPPKPKWKL